MLTFTDLLSFYTEDSLGRCNARVLDYKKMVSRSHPVTDNTLGQLNM